MFFLRRSLSHSLLFINSQSLYKCNRYALVDCPLQIKEESGSFLVTLPCKFAAWDMDKNGSISMIEFAFAEHTAVKDKNTSVVFSKIDRTVNIAMSAI